jgi:TolB-like protein/thioredoxin-like negative regulator of GroEL
MLAIGFLPVVIVAWAFELTPDGLIPESEVDYNSPGFKQFGKKLDRVVMVVLALALGFFAFDKFVLAPKLQTEQMQAAREQGREEALDESFGDKSIAVLPFLDLSAEGDQEYFSDGISEELLNVLAGIPELRVISRSSAFSFKGKDISLAEIGRILDVDHILEGSVRKQGSQIRVTAQLIDTRNDSHLWSKNYDRALDNIFAVQDDIAAKVVEQLKITLLGQSLKATETDPEAYNLYLQAIYILNKSDPSQVEQASELLMQVLEYDPEYAPAWNGLAKVHAWRAMENENQADLNAKLQLALDATNKALIADPDYAPARFRQAQIKLFLQNDIVGGAKILNEAIALHPDSPEALAPVADFLRMVGRLEEAIEIREYIVSRDMTSTSAYRKSGKFYLDARRFEDSEKAFRAALALSPGGRTLNHNLGRALMLQGRPEEALAANQAEPMEFFRLVGMVMAYHDLGRKPEYEATLAELLEKFDEAEFQYAWMFAYCEQSDLAFEYLETLVEIQDVRANLSVEVLFSKLHDDPRWLPYLERIGQSPQQLNAIELDVSVLQILQ